MRNEKGETYPSKLCIAYFGFILQQEVFSCGNSTYQQLILGSINIYSL